MPSVFIAIETALSPARIGRYLPAASGDRQLALRTYIWNARLCEQFLIPVQFAEICVRNMLNAALVRKFGAAWYANNSLLSPLPERLKKEIAKAVSEEIAQHGAAFSADHVVSSLSFGFWVHLTTSSSRRMIWGGRLPAIFPNLPRGVTDSRVYEQIDQLRRFRNRVAHHNAIFDKGPVGEYRNIQDIVGWACADTLWLMRQLSNPATTINRRPAF